MNSCGLGIQGMKEESNENIAVFFGKKLIMTSKL